MATNNFSNGGIFNNDDNQNFSAEQNGFNSSEEFDNFNQNVNNMGESTDFSGFQNDDLFINPIDDFASDGNIAQDSNLFAQEAHEIEEQITQLFDDDFFFEEGNEPNFAQQNAGFFEPQYEDNMPQNNFVQEDDMFAQNSVAAAANNVFEGDFGAEKFEQELYDEALQNFEQEGQINSYSEQVEAGNIVHDNFIANENSDGAVSYSEQNEIAFDIAVPDKEEPEQNESEQEEPMFVSERKFKPLFSQPVPSALDEIRTGVVKPASPISSINANEKPVLITAVEAKEQEQRQKMQVLKTAKEEALKQEQERLSEQKEYFTNQISNSYTSEFNEELSNYPLENQEDSNNDFNYFADDFSKQSEVDFNDTYTQDNFEIANANNFENDLGIQNTDDDFNAQNNFTNEIDDSIINDYVQNDEFTFNSNENESFYNSTDFGFNQPMGEQNADSLTFEQPAFEEQTFEQSGDFNFEQPVLEEQAFEQSGDFNFEQPAFEEQTFEQSGDEFSFEPMNDTVFGEGEQYAEQDEFSQAQNEDFVFDENNDFVAFDENSQQENAFYGDDFNQQEEYNDDVKKFDPQEWEKSLNNDGDDVYTKPKKSNSLLLIVIIVLAVLVICVAGYFIYSNMTGNDPSQPSVSQSTSQSVSQSEVTSQVTSQVQPEPVVTVPVNEWYMLLVNRTNVLSADFTVQTADVDGVPVDSRIAEDLQRMIDDGNATGLQLFVQSGYRTYERQETNYNYQVNLQLQNGLAQAEAEVAAGKITAPPGASEHNSGLGVDIFATDYTEYNINYAQTDEAKWLLENAANYGFILRYPQGKEAITGFEYEPWHYRYVGVEQAQLIKESGLTLEEYLANATA